MRDNMEGCRLPDLKAGYLTGVALPPCKQALQLEIRARDRIL